MENANDMTDELEIKDFTEEELIDESVDWKAKAQESLGIAKRRTTQLEKAKAKLENYEKNWIPKPKEEPKPQDKIENSRTDELDYGQLAFHNTKSDSVKVEHEEDLNFLKETIKETGRNQSMILNSKWFLSELKERQEQRMALEATPSSSKRSGGSSKDTVEYWIDRTDSPDNFELRAKVVNARIAREQKKEGTPH